MITTLRRPGPAATGCRRPDRDARDRCAALDWEPLFSPRSMAVIGASGNAVTVANDFIRQSLALGYKGRIVPVHPSAATIEGLPTAPSLAAAGELSGRHLGSVCCSMRRTTRAASPS